MFQLEPEDYMVCACGKQRDLWIGQLAVLSRGSPLTYAADPILRSFIGVAAFGIQKIDPVRQGPGIRKHTPGIFAHDGIIIWNRGIYNSFDLLHLIRAVVGVAKSNIGRRLFFLGLEYPSPKTLATRMMTDAIQLSDDLIPTDKHVFFNKEGVKHDEGASYLLSADLGVSTLLENVETAFIFCT